MSEHETAGEILNGITALIRAELARVAGEQWHPGGDVDRSDDRIIHGKKKVAALRRIRQEFEDLMAGVC